VRPAILISDVLVLFFGTLLMLTPAITRPTVQFGVRVPPERIGAPVLRDQRRAYYRRAGAIVICCTAVAFALAGHGSWWLPKLVLLAELAAELGCFLLARRKIVAVKNAERWFAGLRQTVVADTGWRTDPPRFPVRWLIPALAVIAATAAAGAVRAAGPRPVIGIVTGEVYVTAVWTGLLLLFFRARPEVEAADPAASVRRYRRFLGAFARAMLTLVALVDLTLLLSALRAWHVYRPGGVGDDLPAVPFIVGLLVLAVVTVRTGQGGHRLPVATLGTARAPAAGVDRDDDRFWKCGVIYLNRDDPALMVGARIGVGFSLNVGNPAAWLIIAFAVAAPAGLTVLFYGLGLAH
jgi:uncharacterized membrane protein